MGIAKVIVVLYLTHSFVLGEGVFGVLLGEAGKERALAELTNVVVNPIDRHPQLFLP